jgi:hypothetical protein
VYYFSYEKQDFINMFNVALQSCMNLLRATFIAAYPGDPSPPPVGDPFIGVLPNVVVPILSYNESLQKFQIFFDIEVWSGANPIIISVNDILNPLLQFPAINTVSQTLYQLEVAINDNYYVPSYYNNSPYVITMKPFVVMYSDHNTLGLFSPLNRIVLASSNLPIVSESVQPAKSVFSSSSPTFVNQVLGAKIITDFQPDFSTTNLVNRDFIQYNQSVNNSRLVSMQGTRLSLSRIDIQVYWSDQNNNLTPVYLYNGTSFDLKIAFVPKNYTCYPQD